MAEAVESGYLGQEVSRGSWKAFKYVLRFLRPQIHRLLLVCLIDVSVTLLNLTMPWLGKSIIDQAFPARDWNLAVRIACVLAGLAASVYLLSALRTYIYSTAEMLVGLDIRRRMYARIQRIALEEVESVPVGQMQFRVSTDADRIAHMLVRILPTCTMLVEFALILVAAVSVDPVLTLVVLGFLVPWTILFVWVTHYGRVYDRRRLKLCELRDASVMEAASSFSTIKALGRSRFERLRNTKANIGVQRVAAQGYLILVGFEFATQKLLPYLKQTTIYVYLIRKVVFGQMTLGMTVPMIAYLGRLAFPLERIVNFGCWIWQTMVSADRLMQILTAPEDAADAPGAVPLGDFSGRLEMVGVSASRPGIGPVLRDVDLTLSPGKMVAVVGPSGAGKSTLVSVALRLVGRDSGQVLLDGKDVDALRASTFRRQCGVVNQHTFIFAGSVRDNLLVADPEASDDRLAAVMDEVGLGPWLAGLGHGLDTDLASGAGLSEGQRQRIGLARAVLGDPKLLLLDEPTSALDAETEALVMAVVRRVSRGRAVLLVTHRLHTVVDADEIVVMDKGAVVERGTHGQLLRSGGLYQRMNQAHERTTVTVNP
ncbi:MAG: ABC transporter ATP-binding protein [Fimbriimonadaceae bacterium]|nr:ABC transporter ATP-binding protein [Fimbriimonadaceae bacterium]